MVAGLTASSRLRITSSITSCPCGSSTEMIGLSRFQQSRSEGSHDVTSASRTSPP
jgi:hypothetical protein